MSLLLQRDAGLLDGTRPHRLFVGSRQVRMATALIEELRRSGTSMPDPITSVDWFLSRTAAWKNMPLALVLQDGPRPVAAALFSAEQRFGMLTGLIRGGNGTGDGMLVGPGERLSIAATAVNAVFDLPWVHTVIASIRNCSPPSTPLADWAGLDCIWGQRTVGTHLSLEGGFEGFLSRLRPRSRRNYRYFRRRAETEHKLSFVPCLRPELAQDAVRQLHAAGMHPIPRARSTMLEAAIRQTPGSFAMGVRGPDGRWLSYLGGWRQPGPRTPTTFVELQLNDHRMQAASLSTVMRTYLIEHEAAQGVGHIVFVGGSSPALGRYCAADECLDLLVTRRGVRGRVARALATTFSPNGQVATMLRTGAGNPSAANDAEDES